MKNPSVSFCSSHALDREELTFSYGLKWALANRGVIVQDKVFYNLQSCELKRNGATLVESISGTPLHVRGNATGGASQITKAEFGKLLRLITSHMSSVSKVYVQDGAVASGSNCDAKVRVISDSPSAILSLSNYLQDAPNRAVSHDSCPLTIYISGSISPKIWQAIGLKACVTTGLVAADVERSSLVLCGRVFGDAKAVKDSLSALAAPVISSRGGIPVNARILTIGDSLILLFALENTIRDSDVQHALVCEDGRVVISSDGVMPFFRSRKTDTYNLRKTPASVVIVSSDSTGVLPLISKISPGQAAYHILAGYHDGKFVPAYNISPTPVDPLALAVAFYSHVKENNIATFLVNVNDGGRHISGKDMMEIAKSTLWNNLPSRKTDVAEFKVRDLKAKYKKFMATRFHEIPEEFTF